MKQGDFSQLAKQYVNRPGYSETVLQVLGRYTGAFSKTPYLIADIGAGTGKLTEMLAKLELPVVAVEPNDEMRAEGQRSTERYSLEWLKGSGEDTGLQESSVNWLLMASSFHWVDLEKGLTEFRRVLRPGGFFTALWNPRDLGRSKLHTKIEARIHEMVPLLKRVSSGSGKYTEGLNEKLVSTGHFEDCVFVEAEHEVVMSKERYLGAWRSVNDIQAQAGPEKFEEIMAAIEQEIEHLEEVVVPYKTRAWTVRRLE